MPATAILIGVMLIALGPIGYFPTDSRSATAWIPAAFGLLILVMGMVASSGGEKARKHAMHAAAGIALLGLIGAAGRAIPAATKLGTDDAPTTLALTMQTAMGAFCLIFLILAVRSFVQARRSASPE